MPQEWNEHHKRSVDGLALELEKSGNNIAAWVKAYETTAKALAESSRAQSKRVAELEELERTAKKRIDEADRRAARVAAAAKRYVELVEDGSDRQEASAKAALLRVCATGGLPVAVKSFHTARSLLCALAGNSSWDAITVVEKGIGTTSVMWKPQTFGVAAEKHPRDIARLAIRELMGIDPDSPEVKDSYLYDQFEED